MVKNTLFSYVLGKLFGKRKHDNTPTLQYGVASGKSDIIPPDAPDKAIPVENEQPEATDVFNSQVISWSDTYSIDRIVGQVLWSDDDHLCGNGEVSATYRVTPLHAFDDQAGHGDYYLVDGTFNIANENMYHPNHANYHGGVRVRIGGFCLTDCEIHCELYDKNGRIDGAKAFSSSPLPETFINEKSYNIVNGWNIGGGITGGIKNTAGEKGGVPEGATEGSATVSFNWGVSHSKSESYKVSDLVVRNTSDKDSVKYKLVNTQILMFDWFSDYGFTDCSDFAKASLTFHASWIWYIPNAKDFDETNKLTIKTTMKPTYKSARFYSTYSDYDDWFDSFERVGYSDLELPNRQPSGIVVIKNDTDETITNVKLYDSDKKVAYASQSSFAPGSDARFCMPTGKFTIEFDKGKTAKDKKTYRYATADSFDISRCNVLNLVAGFDFEEV